MARTWSGFAGHNQSVKEEWALLEACDAQSKLAEGSQRQDREPNKEPKHQKDQAPLRARKFK